MRCGLGLPVLTCLGETFAGRVAASLLNAIGLPELITTTPEAYEQMAIDLAMHPEELAAIKGASGKSSYNTFIRYEAFHQTYRSGLHCDVRAPSGWFGARSYHCAKLK